MSDHDNDNVPVEHSSCGEVFKINLLPVDIIHEILARVCVVFQKLEDYDNDEPGYWPNTPHYILKEKGKETLQAFTYAAVCRLWRDIVMSNGAIWKVLYAKFPEEMMDSDKCLLMEQWFERSSQVWLILPNEASAPNDAKNYSDEMTTLIMSSLHKCTMLSIHRPGRMKSILAQQILHRLKGHLPALETLVIHGSCVFTESINMRGCRNLRSLYFMPGIGLLNFASTNAKTLQRYDGAMESYRLYHVLERNPSLQRCRFGMMDQPPIYAHLLRSPELPVVTMAQMDHLTLTWESGGCIPIFQKTRMPSLKHLDVSFDNGEGPNDADRPYFWPTFHAFLNISRPPLETLRFRMDFPVIESKIIDALSSLPGLKTLQLIFTVPTLTTRFWRTLGAIDNNKGTFLPKIEDLRLYDFQATVEMDDIAFVMLNRFSLGIRRDQCRIPPQNWHYFKVRYCKFSRDELLAVPGMAALVNQGLVVEYLRRTFSFDDESGVPVVFSLTYPDITSNS